MTTNKNKTTFYQYAPDNFEIDKNGTDVSVCVINGEMFMRMDAGGPESMQVVFTKDEFAEFVERCIGVQNA